MLDRFVHHEVAESLTEQVRQRGGEIVVCGRDREHVLCELAEPLLEIGDDVAARPANCRNGYALLPHGANDEEAVVQIGHWKYRLRAGITQLADERRRIVDAERIA